MATQTPAQCLDLKGLKKTVLSRSVVLGELSLLFLYLLISLRLRTNYVIRVMKIKDKGDKALNQIAINR